MHMLDDVDSFVVVQMQTNEDRQDADASPQLARHGFDLEGDAGLAHTPLSLH